MQRTHTGEFAKILVQNLQKIREETDRGGEIVLICCAGTSHGAGKMVPGSGCGDNGRASAVIFSIRFDSASLATKPPLSVTGIIIYYTSA